MSSSSEIDCSQDHLSLFMDDGSSAVKMTGVLYLPTYGLIKGSVEVVRLQLGQDSLEQQCVILEDDLDEDGDPKLLYGYHDVTAWLRTNPTEGHRVVENSKLAVYSQYRDSPETRRFYRALGANNGNEHALQWFTTLRIKHLLRRALAHFKKWAMKTVKCHGLDWEKLPKAMKFTVPAIVNNLMCGMYKTAGVENGLRNIQLHLEPCCAAAGDIPGLLEEGAITHGDSMIWHDIGHLTNDLAVIRIDRPRSQDERPQLKITHPPSGDLHGSHVVHQMAYEYVLRCDEVDKHGGIDSVLARLGGMSHEELARQVSAEIDHPKKMSSPRDFCITIFAPNDKHLGVPEGIPMLSVRIKADRMQSWLNEWGQRLVESQEHYLRAHGLENALMVVLTGGGSCNYTSSKLLADSGQRMGIAVRQSLTEMAVARGGHEQYPRNAAGTLRYGCWYLPRDELLNEGKHRDAYLNLKKKEHNPNLVIPSIEGNGLYAKDRLVLALRRLPDLPQRTWRIPMTFPIALPDGLLGIKIYFSERLQRNGSPLLDRDGNVRELYSPYQVQFADLNVDWATYEAQLDTYRHENTLRTNLNGFVQMDCGDDSWHLKVTILKPGVKFLKQDLKVALVGPKSARFDPNKVLAEYTKHIWDKHCTHDVIDVSLDASATTARSRKRRAESSATPRVNMTTRRMKAEQALLETFETASTDSSTGREVSQSGIVDPVLDETREASSTTSAVDSMLSSAASGGKTSSLARHRHVRARRPPN